MRWLKAILPKEERFFALFRAPPRRGQWCGMHSRDTLSGESTAKKHFTTVMEREDDADASPARSSWPCGDPSSHPLTEEISRT